MDFEEGALAAFFLTVAILVGGGLITAAVFGFIYSPIVTAALLGVVGLYLVLWFVFCKFGEHWFQ